MRKFRLSDEETRAGLAGLGGSSSHSGRGTRLSRSSIEQDGILREFEALRVRLDSYLVFKVPGEAHDRAGVSDGREEDRDERSASAPLLAGSSRRSSSAEELDELERTEGPQQGAKGTLLDGIANVSYEGAFDFES
jgi:hypothetical protein